jgi:diacylglycerol O-acyltransferase
VERLTPLADAFLEAEDVDPGCSMAIGSLAVFDGPAPSFERVRSAIAGRLPLIPRYRQRLRPAALGLAAPAWVDALEFDIRDHVRSIRVPSPAGPDEVGDLLSQLMVTRMDRSRPLWEYWVCEGLPEGRWAILSKVHHCLADGVSGSDLYHLLLDPTPEPRPAVEDDWQPEPPTPLLRDAAESASSLLETPLRASRALAGALRTPRRLLRTGIATAEGMWEISRGLLPYRGSSLTGPLSGRRRYAWATVPMSDVHRVRAAHSATVNDVALSLVAGSFRHLLLARGDRPDGRTLRALVPVSTRADGAESDLGNQVSLLLPFLPVDVADPAERLAVVRSRVRELRAHHEADAGERLTVAAGYGPFPPVALGVRLGWRLPQRVVATVATNVPGPRTPLYALGREMVQVLPYVPIADRVRVGMAMFSYRDELTFGITADREHVPDVGVLADGIVASLAELDAAIDAGVVDGGRGGAL